jgi:hypothetical protein
MLEGESMGSASQKMVPREESSIMRPRGAVAVGGVAIVTGTSTREAVVLADCGLLALMLAAGSVDEAEGISVFAAASSSPIADSIRA